MSILKIENHINCIRKKHQEPLEPIVKEES